MVKSPARRTKMQNHGTKWIVKRTLAYSVRAAPKRQSLDFPLSPVVKMPHFHCRGHRFYSLVPWELRSSKLHSIAKKKVT